jgi:hypothetical protein
MVNEETKSEELQPDLSGLLQKVKQHLYLSYTPVSTEYDADFHLTTTEVWQRLLMVFPNETILTKDIVAAWMHEGGFTFLDFGNMRLEWLLKKNISLP